MLNKMDSDPGFAAPRAGQNFHQEPNLIHAFFDPILPLHLLSMILLILSASFLVQCLGLLGIENINVEERKSFMKKSILILGLILGVTSLSFADNKPSTQKPPHYGDWDVIYDKVMKRTTLIHQHRPYGQPIPGMGDALTTDSFQLQYSFKAVISGVPGTKSYKADYYLLFDDPINRNATLALAVANRFFKYSPQTQFTLLCDDSNKTFPIENYHTGEFGDAFIGHRPFEEHTPLHQH